VHFDDPIVLLVFLPALFAVYYSVIAAEGVYPRFAAVGARGAAVVLLAGSVWLLAQSPVGWLLLGSAFVTTLLAATGEQLRSTHAFASRCALALAMTATVVMFAIARAILPGGVFELAGVSVVACQELAFILDVHLGRATTANPVTAWLYLVQFPVLPAGPLIRFQDIDRRWRTLSDGISLGAFTYGMRRLITGLIKVVGIAATLAVPVDAIYRLPAARLSTDAAWFAALCFSLQLYFLFSGYADLAIGLGRMLGLRYPENFHRPYLADSIREFWRRWHVTSITWLRDYFAFPIAGRDAPTLRLLPSIVTGFALLGFWYGGGWTVALWAVYSSAFLAFEAIGFGARISFWPRAIRHLYVLLVVTIGWAILRADSMAAAGNMLQVMTGLKGLRHLTVARYLTLEVSIALIVAIVGAGPLIPWLSRWRVSVDAVTAATVMMLTSLSLFVWRGWSLLWRALTAQRPDRRTKL
jgi:D-alanyl-lipoteichoic acid acyltransferase DltB (MBOAT superfamily)